MKLLNRKRRLVTVGSITVLAAAALVAVGFSGPPAKGAERTDTMPTVQALSNAFEQVADKASPAVVHIRVEKTMRGAPAIFEGPDGSGGPQEFFRRFFGPQMDGQGDQGESIPNQVPVPVGEGSGFIISPDGYIVTNHHVADGADRVNVTLQDGRAFDAKVIGSDKQTDVALLKVDATGLPTVQLGDSDNIRVGEWLIAIGSPFGLSHSVTSGIVSARHRGNVGIVDYADFIQTDAAINPGNSGGPLLNMDGAVIGMNTAIVSRTGGSNGVGFAIPVNVVKYVVDQLRTHGSITRGFMGISIQDLTPDLAKWFTVDGHSGILVSEVTKGSPADRAGLQRDDVIVKFDGRPVDEIGAFRTHVATTPAGTKVDLTIVRDGKTLTKTVEIGGQAGEQLAKADISHPAPESSLGIAVQGLTDNTAKRLGYEGESGVVVSQVAPGSAADQAGVKPGDLIREVNRKEINNPRDFQEALEKGGKDHTALLLIQEGQAARYVALQIA